MRWVALIAASILWLSTAAAAGQMDARTKPQVSGPLVSSDDSYSGNSCTTERMRPDNKVAAVIVWCWSFYRFDPAAETDAGRDFGVWWLQATFKGRNGWCVKKANASLGMPADFDATASTEKSKELATRRSLHVALLATAQGAATEPGKVSTKLVAHPGRYITFWDASVDSYKLKWRGNTRRKVALAGGIEGYWNATTDPPIFLTGSKPAVVRC